ncbi:hypothetical protein [Nocardia sp. NPDC058114]|uniref:hypothetical protein n=1 Tax=Nocardia sp. NPDC058114 TaxID=3346346 RepID=UPI0036D86782
MLYAAGILVALVGLIAAGHSPLAGLGLLGFAVTLLTIGGVLSFRNSRRLRSKYQRLRIDTGGKAGRRGIDDADSLSSTYGGGD